MAPGSGATALGSGLPSEAPTKLELVSETLDKLKDEAPTSAPVAELELDEVEAEETESRLDPEIAARRDAALVYVRQFGDPILKTKARPVMVFDEALRSEVERMGSLMDDALGVGLAATQVGVLHRLLVYRVQSGGPLGVLINPQLEWSSKEEEIAEEGCLSLQTVHVEVERPIHVRVRAQDAYGDPIVVEASGFEARVIQHEMDHLDGVLILDRTPRDQRKEAMRSLRERQLRSDV
jgi:peptide deformylase